MNLVVYKIFLYACVTAFATNLSPYKSSRCLMKINPLWGHKQVHAMGKNISQSQREGGEAGEMLSLPVLGRISVHLGESLKVDLVPALQQALHLVKHMTPLSPWNQFT